MVLLLLSEHAAAAVLLLDLLLAEQAEQRCLVLRALATRGPGGGAWTGPQPSWPRLKV